MRCNLLIVANSSSCGRAGGMASVKPADARARHVCKKTPDGSANCAPDVRDVANCAALREAAVRTAGRDQSRGVSVSSGRGWSRRLPSGSVTWHSVKMRAVHAAHFAASSLR